MEPEGSLPHSQEPVIRPYSEPDHTFANIFYTCASYDTTNSKYFSKHH